MTKKKIILIKLIYMNIYIFNFVNGIVYTTEQCTWLCSYEVMYDLRLNKMEHEKDVKKKIRNHLVKKK